MNRDAEPLKERSDAYSGAEVAVAARGIQGI